MARHHVHRSPDYGTAHIDNEPCDIDDCGGDHVYVYTADDLHDLLAACLDDHDRRPIDDEHVFDVFDVAAWYDDYERAAAQFEHDATDHDPAATVPPRHHP